MLIVALQVEAALVSSLLRPKPTSRFSCGVAQVNTASADPDEYRWEEDGADQTADTVSAAFERTERPASSSDSLSEQSATSTSASPSPITASSSAQTPLASRAAESQSKRLPRANLQQQRQVYSFKLYWSKRHMAGWPLRLLISGACCLWHSCSSTTRWSISPSTGRDTSVICFVLSRQRLPAPLRALLYVPMEAWTAIAVTCSAALGLLAELCSPIVKPLSAGARATKQTPAGNSVRRAVSSAKSRWIWFTSQLPEVKPDTCLHGLQLRSRPEGIQN